MTRRLTPKVKARRETKRRLEAQRKRVEALFVKARAFTEAGLSAIWVGAGEAPLVVVANPSRMRPAGYEAHRKRRRVIARASRQRNRR